MKRLVITLEEYIKYGGSLDKISLAPVVTTYSDSNKGKVIDNITLGPVKQNTYPSKNTTQLYTVIFADGNQHNYAGGWIEISVDFVLDNIYR